MGNQHGTKPKSSCYRQNWDVPAGFPRILVPQRSRRERDTTAGRGQRTLKENQQPGLHRTSSSIFRRSWTPSQMLELSDALRSAVRKDFTDTDHSDSDFSDYHNQTISIFHASEPKPETVELKSRLQAAQRVLTRIQEVEEILHRVTVTSSQRARAHSHEDSQTSQRTLQRPPDFRCQSDEDRTLMVEELYDAQIQSLLQVLKMEAGPSETEDHLKTPSPEVCPPSLSESSSFESLSPVLSSPLPPRPSVGTCQQNAGTPDTDSGNDSLIALEAGGCERSTRSQGGAENGRRGSLTWKYDLLCSGKNMKPAGGVLILTSQPDCRFD